MRRTLAVILVALAPLHTDVWAQGSVNQLDTQAVRSAFRRQAAADPRTAWLRQHALRVRTIDPAADDFNDLEPLRSSIGAARIVMLGEQSHGEGSTFLGKARLVRFLHERMGFDVIAIETPQYDAIKAWSAIQTGMDVDSAFRRSVFAVWTRTAQFQPLIDYVREQAGTKRPLILSGFDSQLYHRFSQDSLVPELHQLARRLDTHAASFAEDAPFRRELTNLVMRRPVAEFLVDSLDVFARRVDSAAMRLGLRDSFPVTRQALNNLRRYARQNRITAISGPIALDVAKAALWSAGGGVRDRQMAENILWLARTHFPGRKIIVWAASGHTRYRDPASEDPFRAWDFGTVVTKNVMGQFLRAELGDSVYSIMFTSYDGVAGSPTWREPYPLEVHSGEVGRNEVDFEDMMTAAGVYYGFVDLRAGRRINDWRNQPFLARPISHVPMKARWPDSTDAFFFIRTVQPATPVVAR